MPTRTNQALKAQLRTSAQIRAAGRQLRMSHHRRLAEKRPTDSGGKGYWNIMRLLGRNVLPWFLGR